MVGGADGDVVVMEPETDLVAWLYAELGPQLLRDDNLPLRSDAVSHTGEYNLGAIWVPVPLARRQDGR